MAALEKKTMEWAATAPVQLAGRAHSTATPEAVFAVLADHDRWPEWFPNVRSVEVLGPAEGVGARRRVKVPGLTVDEEFIAWEPGALFAFTGTAASPRFTRGLVEHDRLEPAAGGGTDITYTMCLDPSGVAGILTRLAASRVRASLGQATRNLARRAAEAGAATSGT